MNFSLLCVLKLVVICSQFHVSSYYSNYYCIIADKNQAIICYMPKNQIIYILKFNQETIRNAFDVLIDCIFSSFITWLAFKRSVWDGVSNFLVNSAITKTQIWTQSTSTLIDY